MKKRDPLVEPLIELLKTRGHRRTPVRETLLELFTSEEKPFSVADLLKRFTTQGIRVNKTTLYRELDFFEKEGIVTSIRWNERQVRYELADEHNMGHHHHVVCTSCDRVEDVNLPGDLLKHEMQIEALTRFSIQRHALEFFGVCFDCQKKDGFTPRKISSVLAAMQA